MKSKLQSTTGLAEKSVRAIESIKTVVSANKRPIKIEALKLQGSKSIGLKVLFNSNGYELESRIIRWLSEKETKGISQEKGKDCDIQIETV